MVGTGAVVRSSRRAISRRTGIIAASRHTNSISAPLYPGVDLAIYSIQGLKNYYRCTLILMRIKRRIGAVYTSEKSRSGAARSLNNLRNISSLAASAGRGTITRFSNLHIHIHKNDADND